MSNILFITWDGPQVNYLEGLFLPIFEGLSDHGHQFHVLQFTWAEPDRIAATEAACRAAGVPYRAVKISRRFRPLGPVMTAIWGTRHIKKSVRNWNIDTLMPRSIMPALAVLTMGSRKKLKMVFDADGLSLDERVDFGDMSPSGLTYRLLRDVEAQCVRQADAVLTRTDKAIDILLSRAGAGTPREHLYKVSNGRDIDQFMPIDLHRRRKVRARLGIEDQAPLLTYAGSLGRKYLLSEMLTLFSAVLLRRPDAHLLILTGSPDIVAEGIKNFPEIRTAVVTLSVSHREVPEYLAAADVGLALIKPSFSMQAATAIKVGEYLLCGLPVIATNGVGDASSILSGVGVGLNEPNMDDLQEAARWFAEKVLPEREQFRIRCREVGVEHYSLTSSVASYLRALESLSP